MAAPASSFIHKLLDAIPELVPVYKAHLTDNDELLPHVFMGDVTIFVIAHSGNPSTRPVLQRLLGLFEDELAGEDDDAINVVLASFVENLLGEEEAARKLSPLMGPRLRAALDFISRER
jgi:hypothetical protein